MSRWVVFSYSLPSKSGSAARVALWRRLQRLGAVSPTSGTFVLPAKEDLVEAFQWLAQEVRGEKGQALVMHVDDFDGLDERELIGLFQAARREEYQSLLEETRSLEASVAAAPAEGRQAKLAKQLAKLEQQRAELARIDYFSSPDGADLAARIQRLQARMRPAGAAAEEVDVVSVDGYQGRVWVTRPRPYVDRLASAWLIRRHIDPGATIRYAARARSGEVSFDTVDAEFGHQGNLCTFEVLAHAFDLAKDAAIQAIGEIVHDIDLRDGRYQRPEASGIESVLRGWLAAKLPDEELEARGLQFFDGLYESLSRPAAR